MTLYPFSLCLPLLLTGYPVSADQDGWMQVKPITCIFLHFTSTTPHLTFSSNVTWSRLSFFYNNLNYSFEYRRTRKLWNRLKIQKVCSVHRPLSTTSNTLLTCCYVVFLIRRFLVPMYSIFWLQKLLFSYFGVMVLY